MTAQEWYEQGNAWRSITKTIIIPEPAKVQGFML